MEIPLGPITVAAQNSDCTIDEDRITGSLHRVPWCSSAERIVVLVEDSIVTVSPASEGITIFDDTNLAGEDRSSILFERTKIEDLVRCPEPVTLGKLKFRGALSRSALMSGAIDATTDLTLGYASDRRQFGLPLARFQGVQAHLVSCIESAALVDLAVRSAAVEAATNNARFGNCCSKGSRKPRSYGSCEGCTSSPCRDRYDA